MKNLVWILALLTGLPRVSAAELSDSEGFEKGLSQLKITSGTISQENLNEGYIADNERANSPRSQQVDDSLLEAFVNFLQKKTLPVTGTSMIALTEGLFSTKDPKADSKKE